MAACPVPAIWLVCVSVRAYLNLTSSPSFHVFPSLSTVLAHGRQHPLNGQRRRPALFMSLSLGSSTWAARHSLWRGFPRKLLDVSFLYCFRAPSSPGLLASDFDLQVNRSIDPCFGLDRAMEPSESPRRLKRHSNHRRTAGVGRSIGLAWIGKGINLGAIDLASG